MDSLGKRSHSYYDNDVAERKRRVASDTDESNDTEYRILCPGKKIGIVIGKGGNVIKSLREETCSKIKVEDPIPGSDERVIYICSSAEGKGRSGERGRNGEEKMICASQEALFKVHEIITDTHGGVSDDDEDDDEPPKSVMARLLVPNRQVGCLIGKGGQVIEQMRRDIGGQIRVLPKEQRPVCARPDDEIVQLSGDPVVVRKALYAISSLLHENPRRQHNQRDASYQQALPSDNSPFASVDPRGSFLNPPSAGGAPLGLNYLYPLGGFSNMGIGSAWPLGPGYPSLPGVGGPYIHSEGSAEQFVIRVLCPNDIVGSLIGRNGNAIRKLREDTGARIQVNPVSVADEHIIEITSSEYLDSPISQGINAALHVQSRIAELNRDEDQEINNVTTRLLVPHEQIGSVIGKGGATITEIRKATKANIRIPSKDERPPVAGENDELVQIVGDIKVAEHALIQVLTQLRNKLFKTQDVAASMPATLPGLPLHGNTSFLPSYGGILSAERLYPLNGSGPQQPLSYSGYGSSLDGASILETVPGKSTNKESRRKQK